MRDQKSRGRSPEHYKAPVKTDDYSRAEECAAFFEQIAQKKSSGNEIRMPFPVAMTGPLLSFERSHHSWLILRFSVSLFHNVL